MTSAAFEAFLAKIYTDPQARERFVQNPTDGARAAGLSEAECVALAEIDIVGLEMAARSFATKRDSKARRRPSVWRRLYTRSRI
jgi:hypothetical protein